MRYPIRNAVIFSGLSCLVLVGASLQEFHLTAAVAKVGASVGFLAVAVLCGAFRSTYGKILFAGLTLAAMGDVFLIGESQALFLAGLSAFLLAHIVYIAAFMTLGINWFWAGSAFLPVAGLALGVTAWLAPHTSSELAIPVHLYITAISGMVIVAIGTRGRGATRLILAGALLFFLSDLSVASLRIVQVEFPNYVWGLPLYYAGQLCLSLSVSQSRSH